MFDCLILVLTNENQLNKNTLCVFYQYYIELLGC